MRKLLLSIFMLFAATSAHAGFMVNVEYIHQLIARNWGVEIEYNPELSTPNVAANMKYLLTAVDVANEMLNGEKITDYGNGEYATMAAADTIAANEATSRLVKIEPKFWVTTTADTSEFKFSMSAKGTFQVFWGDGTNDIIIRTDTENATYTHAYTEPGEYKIGFGGRATRYSTTYGYSTALYLGGTVDAPKTNIAGISGSLGAIFPTIGDGSGAGEQPIFEGAFAYCPNLTGPIPPDLFTGVHGQPVTRMFMWTFLRCFKLSGEIPPNLFAGLEGVVAPEMFRQTFLGDGELTGNVSAGMLGKLEGMPDTATFTGMFGGCRKLKGCIPNDWFSGIDMSLDEIISEYGPFDGSGITQSLCPISEE